MPSLPSPLAVKKAPWPLDIRIMAKWVMFFGVLMYGFWTLRTFEAFDGLFRIGGNSVLGGDFINDWAAARLTLDHHVMTLFDLEGFHRAQETFLSHRLADFHNWSYPPSFLPWILWLGFFTYPVALLLWLLVTFGLYAFAVSAKRSMPWGVSLVLLLAPASYVNFDIGQNGFLSAALLVGGLRLLRPRPLLAGVLFGLLLYKPQLGLLVPFALLAGREWRALLTASLTVVASLAASLILYGVEPWQVYLTTTLPYQMTRLEFETSTLFLNLVPSVFNAARLLGGSLAIAWGAQIVAAMLALFAVLYTFGRRSESDLRAAVLLTAVFLTSPYIFCYDMPALAAALVSLVAAAGSRLKGRGLSLVFAGWLLPALVYPLNRAGIPLAPFMLLTLLGFEISLLRAQDTPHEKVVLS